MLATRADVIGAYRLLLGREPDKNGLEGHLKWARSCGATPAQIAERFLTSSEYQRHADMPDNLAPVDFGTHVVFARKGDTLISESVILTGIYEPNVMNRFISSLKDGDCVLDIGANIGLYTMSAAARVGKHGKVIAVEPLPMNHRSLYAGIVYNKFSNVQVLPIAASDHTGLIPIRCASDSSNGIVGADEGSRDPDTYVPAHRLDDLLSTLTRVDVIKIDIEGHEPAAWEGMKSLVQRHHPLVFSEFSPIAMRNVGQDPLEYLRMLFENTKNVLVLHRDVDAVVCGDASAVMDEWQAANNRMGYEGRLHLDLLVQT